MKLVSVLFCSLLLIGCGTIAPEKPSSIIAPVTPVPQPISYLSIPIEVNLRPYLTKLEKEVPSTLTGKEEQCEGISVAYRFQRNPITFSGTGSKIRYSVEGKYGLKINYCPKCTGMFGNKENCVVPRFYASCGENGESMRRIKLSYETDLSLQKNWQLLAQTRLKDLTPIDPCNITFMQYDATQQVVDEVNKELTEVAKTIDNQIANYPLKREVDQLWKSLHAPISLGSFGFLSIQPQSLGVKSLQFDQQTLRVQVVAGIQPLVTLNKPTLSTSATPLNNAPETPSDFLLYVDLNGTYDSINRLLATHFSHQELSLKGRTFIIESTEITGTQNDQFILKVRFSGNKAGTLYFQATPAIDSTGTELRFTDVTFDLATKNVLMKSAKWLLNKRVTEKIEREFRYSLQPILLDARRELERQLNDINQGGLKFSGRLQTIQIDQIVPQRDFLLLRASIRGNLRLSMP